MTDHIGPERFTLNERVTFVGYPGETHTGTVTLVLDEPRTGEITGYILLLDGGATLCAEPDQLHREEP